MPPALRVDSLFMKNDNTINLLYSEPAKIIFGAIFIVSVLSLCGDIYIYYDNNDNTVDLNSFYSNMFGACLSFLYFKLYVKESSLIKSFSKSRVGILLYGVIIIAFTIYGLKFPHNVIVLIFILSFPTLYFIRRHYKKKDFTNKERK